MPLGSLKGAARNPKRHSPDIGKSIDRFGYIEPIILNEATGRLVAGHGRIESLKARKEGGGAVPEGIKENHADWLVPVIRGKSFKDEAEAEAYLIASNQLTIGGGWLAEIGDILNSLPSLEGLGFEQGQIKAFKAFSFEKADFVPGNEWRGMPEFSQDDQRPYRTIFVHFKSQEAVKRFAGLIQQPISDKTRMCWFPHIEIETYLGKRYDSES
jgi:hypothetical protein